MSRQNSNDSSDEPGSPSSSPEPGDGPNQDGDEAASQNGVEDNAVSLVELSDCSEQIANSPMVAGVPTLEPASIKIQYAPPVSRFLGAVQANLQGICSPLVQPAAGNHAAAHHTAAHGSPAGDQAQDLRSLLGQLGLTKYLPNFEDQDVDLQVFLSLTDNDLKELGIK